MSPARTERAARTALVAFYRVFRTQGIQTLRTDELAASAGLKSRTFDPAVLQFMLNSGWLTPNADELELTELGKIEAQDIVYER
jgi:hypothetical protein